MKPRFIQSQLSRFQETVSGTFLLLFMCIILILVPCALITSYADRLISEKIRSANQNFLYAAADSIDSSIRMPIEQSSLIIETNFPDYYSLLYADSISHSDTVLSSYRLNNALYGSNYSLTLFNTTVLYFKNPGIVLTASGSYDAQTFFQKKYIFADYSADYFDRLMEMPFKSQPCPATPILTRDIQGDETTYYESVIPFAIHPVNSSPADAMFIFLLSEVELNRMLDSINSNQSCYIYLMDTVTGSILNHPSDTDYASQLSLSEQEYSGSSGFMTLEGGSGSCRVLWCNSGVSKLRYICVEPRLLITRQLRTFLMLTYSITIVVVIIMILCHRIFARWLARILSPMFLRLEKAFHLDKNPPSLKRNDIRSLKEALDLLCTQYEANYPNLVSSFLSRLLQNDATDEEILEFCSHFTAFQPQDYFSILVLRTNFWSYEKTVPPSPQDVLASLRQQLNDYGYVISLRDGTDCLLFLTAPTQQKLKSLRSRFLHSLKDIAPRLPEFVCGQSADYHSIHETFHHYHQVLNLLDYYGIAYEKAVYSMEDLRSASVCVLSAKEKDRILALASHSPNECLACISQLMSSWKKQNAGFAYYRNTVTELLFLLQQILCELTIPFSAVFHDSEGDLAVRAERILTPGPLDHLCLEAYRQLTEVMKDRNLSIEQAEQTLLQYIEEHLADINLTVLSDVAGMNQNYLSHYFKKHFGITFLDYVTRKKIEKAKELLRGTDLTCKAIGESLGYHDPNTFIRSFKKLEAVTPNEYRRMHKKQPG